jgi:hypothetical protein
MHSPNISNINYIYECNRIVISASLVARARLALGGVEVLPGDGIKRHVTHVQLSTQRCLWEKLTTWSARINATRIYTLDGGGARLRLTTGS